MELKAQLRTVFGRKTKSLRNDGFVPAELYGHGVENLHLKVEAREFEKVYREAGESTVVNLDLGGDKENRSVMIYNVVNDPVTDKVLNIDFYQVRLDEEIQVDVPIVFAGVSLAVKEGGGVLVKAIQEIEVEALPNNIPHDITVDISVLKTIGQSIHVRELNIPEGIKVSLDPETVVATVTEKMAEEVAPVAEVDLSEVKTESELKKETAEAKKASSEEAPK
jgi:large subunit ribosomal protein L25